MKPTKVTNGLIVYCAENKKKVGHFIALIIYHQKLRLMIDLGSGLMQLHLNNTLYVNRWYNVILKKKKKTFSLTLDSQIIVNKTVSTLSLVSSKLRTLLYLGGVDNEKVYVNQNIKFNSSFQGCLDKVSLNFSNLTYTL